MKELIKTLTSETYKISDPDIVPDLHLIIDVINSHIETISVCNTVEDQIKFVMTSPDDTTLDDFVTLINLW